MDGDPKAAKVLLDKKGRLLKAEDQTELAQKLDFTFEGMEHRTDLREALEEEIISPEQYVDLFNSYNAAGYFNRDQEADFKRRILEQHKRFVSQMLQREKDEQTYSKMLNSFRTQRFLTEGEIGELEQMVNDKLYPAGAASRLFTEAVGSKNTKREEGLLERYLTKFEGHDDFARAANRYIALNVGDLWKRLSSLGSPRDATLAVEGLNAILTKYVDQTSSADDTIPITRVVEDFKAHSQTFSNKIDEETDINVKHNGRAVEITSLGGNGLVGDYVRERNGYVKRGKEEQLVL